MFDKAKGTPFSPRPALVLTLVCAAIFMLMLDATVVAAALAGIRADFHTSIDGLQWVIDAYALPLAGLLLTFATVGDRYGRKRVFVAGMGVFTTSSLALSLAGTDLVLNGLRAVQGVGAAMLFATALPILADAYLEHRPRMRAIGIYSAVMGAATAAGPVVGGILVTAFGWRSIFLLNVPIGVIVLVLAARSMSESRRPSARKSDWPGSILLTSALVAGVLCFTRGRDLGWHSAALLSLAAVAVVLFVAFLVWEARSKHPLFDLTMVRRPGFFGTALTALTFMATLMAATNYLALFMVGTLGYTPLQMGLRVLPITIGALVAAPIAARLLQRVPFSVALPASLAIVVAGLALMNAFPADGDWLHFLPGMIVGGIGLGAVTSANQAASLTFAPPEDAGMSSATFATLRQVGMAMGVAVLGVVFDGAARATGRHDLASVPGIGSAPHSVVGAFLDAVGAGSGSQVVHELPQRYSAVAPALDHVARAASIDGLNALVLWGTVAGAIGLSAVVVLFVVDRFRARSLSTMSVPEPEIVESSGE
jgi:EmrB/QacA subfamily drug resistance transporter